MPEDIGGILKNWPYDPDSSIRRITDPEGTEKIQVRVDQGAFQGVLQMELDGRPDGRRPHNRSFALDFFKETLQNHILDMETDEGFLLKRNHCKELFDESRRLYER